MKKKILVTGGSGFIGTNLIDFYKDSSEILNIDIVKPRNKAHLVYWEKVDILELKNLTKKIEEFSPDIIFHMAARTDLEGKTLQAYEANTTGVKNIISAIENVENLEKIIFASSRLVCEIGYEPKDEFDYKPSTIYGESKIIGEKIVRESTALQADWILVRPTSLWGPWFEIPYKNFFTSIKKKLYFHPKGKEIYKKFGFVLNSVYILDAFLKDSSLHSKTVYLSDFKALEVGHWANLISQDFHHKNTKQLPYFLLKAIAVLGDLAKKGGYKNPPLTTFRLNNLVTPMDFNTLEVQNIVGELPFTLRQATKITCTWLKEH
ncbi:NDP-sugar dehydratase or epimerase [Polaribacter pacificus]|uniref:NDP-sugar dehydratase or epimerase n=1 Tax=Polaribacter pacificus TaxID=1775173 RepID=A0A917HWA9_9FLAO|nr:NAD(P)-dependent oxidoreductase [Polaribacter pacificus]GGG93677.1 NDP-sugar dehydratase or epimerase [Polaribacter pacificus]